MSAHDHRGVPSSWRLWVTGGIALLVLAVDQLTKAIVLERLGPDSGHPVVEVIPGILRFLYVENTGAAFGLFQGNSMLLTVFALAVVSFLLVYFRRAIARSSWLAVALGLQFGGAFGNIIDRIRYGFVIDFINVPRWPTFNVADSAITVGVVILAVTLIFAEQVVYDEDGQGDAGPQQMATSEEQH